MIRIVSKTQKIIVKERIFQNQNLPPNRVKGVITPLIWEISTLSDLYVWYMARIVSKAQKIFA